MNTLRMFEKPTIIRIETGSGKHISARTLFTHLREALEGQDLSGVTTLTIAGDGSVLVDGQTVYRPRRMQKTAKNESGL